MPNTTKKATQRVVTSRVKLSPEQLAELLKALKTRFEKNMNRHKGIEWAKVQAKLEINSQKLWSLNEMEETGGEPDVVAYDKKTGEYVFYGCSAESPTGRRSICYDTEALESRKEHKPKINIVNCKNWESSIQKLPVGLKRQKIYGNWEGQFLGIGVTVTYSFITTEPNLTMPQEDSGAP